MTAALTILITILRSLLAAMTRRSALRGAHWPTAAQAAIGAATSSAAVTAAAAIDPSPPPLAFA